MFGVSPPSLLLVGHAIMLCALAIAAPCRYGTQPGCRSAAVGILLCTAGTATLASLGWGLKNQGLFCSAVMLFALAAVRGLANGRAG